MPLRRLSEIVPGRRKPVVATIGVFDGVHLGHLKILSLVQERARKLSGISAVVTFAQHPLAAVAPARAPRCIMTAAQRLRRLKSLGFSRIVVLPFNREIAGLSACAFINCVLLGKLHVKELIVGGGFRFGKGRKGGPGLLKSAGALNGFATKFVPPVLRGGTAVSSTRIRRLILSGRLRPAARLLGGPYAVEGRRVSGRRLGRRMGFPTVNVLLDNPLLPPFGAYAVRVPAIGAAGVANLGVKPTVAARPGRPLLEIHFFRRPPARLPKYMEVELAEFLRPERKFRSVAELSKQIGRDAAKARRILARAGSRGGAA